MNGTALASPTESDLGIAAGAHQSLPTQPNHTLLGGSVLADCAFDDEIARLVERHEVGG